MMKAQGAPDEEIKAQRAKIRKTDDEIDDFCESTGRARRQSREGVYTKREFPDANRYDVTQFENQQKAMIDKYFMNGGSQQGYTFGQMTPNEQNTPTPTPPATPAIPAPAQSAPATPTNVREQDSKANELIETLQNMGVSRRTVERYTTQPTEQEIIAKLAGADKTKGSCSSLALAYAGNKSGLDVTDFRGGQSRSAFSSMGTIKQLFNLDGIQGKMVRNSNDFTNAHQLLKEVQDGKEYYFTAGKHAAVVRKSATGYEYLEMQSGYRKNTWYELNDSELRRRFGCQRSHTTYGLKYEVTDVIFDIDSVKGNMDFAELMEFINTAPDAQQKGVGGGEK
jgi:hypothetical protein